MKYDKLKQELSDRALIAAMRIADLRCRKAGRKTWDWGDFNAYIKAYHRLWPAGRERKLTIGEWEKRYSSLHHGYKRGKMGHKPLQYPFEADCCCDKAEDRRRFNDRCNCPRCTGMPDPYAEEGEDGQGVR